MVKGLTRDMTHIARKEYPKGE